MRKWIRRIRGAVVVGLVWGLAWGIIGGAIMEGIVDPHGRIADMWPQPLAIAGFFSGVIFSVALALAERRRRFQELSMLRFTALGAVAGAALGALGTGLMGIGALIMVPLSLLGAASAAGSLALARKAVDREQLGAGQRPGDDEAA